MFQSQACLASITFGSLLAASVAFAAPGAPPAGYTLVRVSDAVPSSAIEGVSQLIKILNEYWFNTSQLP